MDLEYFLDWPSKFFKGDSEELPVTVLNKDLTDHKIRCEVADDYANCIRLATANVTNGSADQIEITNAASGQFTIKVLKGTTECFDSRFFIEVELEDADGKITTLFKKQLEFTNQIVDWDDK